jgi:GTP cyclohydrolase-4
MSMQDVQNSHSTKTFAINRVGIRNVIKPACIQRPDKVVMLTANIDVSVDLPPELKGAHLSRNMEVLTEIVDNSIRTPAESVESLCVRCAKGILEKHEYASLAEVSISATYFLSRGKKQSIENYVLSASAVCRRNGAITRKIGVKATGITACPCAMETMREKLKKMYRDNEILEKMPVITHNQRNTVSIEMELPEGMELEADDLIEICEKSMSSPTYGILKRDDEGEVVFNAHQNPKFVEDVVREALLLILKRYAHFPDATGIVVRSESEESIHKHNAFAEKITTIGELKREISAIL